jgi:hypothetical protein
MIPFQTWLLQILGYCQFVADAVAVRRAWIERDFSSTSVTDFEELYEQIFDDLDSNNVEKELVKYFPADLAVRRAVSEFLDAIRVVDSCRESSVQLRDPECLLKSDEWLRLIAAADQVLQQIDKKSIREIDGGDH